MEEQDKKNMENTFLEDLILEQSEQAWFQPRTKQLFRGTMIPENKKERL